MPNAVLVLKALVPLSAIAGITTLLWHIATNDGESSILMAGIAAIAGLGGWEAKIIKDLVTTSRNGDNK